MIGLHKWYDYPCYPLHFDASLSNYYFHPLSDKHQAGNNFKIKIPSDSRAINCHLSLQLRTTLGLGFGNGCRTCAHGLNVKHALVLSPALWIQCPEPLEPHEGLSVSVSALIQACWVLGGTEQRCFNVLVPVSH